jgi:hypothetical protein
VAAEQAEFFLLLTWPSHSAELHCRGLLVLCCLMHCSRSLPLPLTWLSLTWLSLTWLSLTWLSLRLLGHVLVGNGC